MARTNLTINTSRLSFEDIDAFVSNTPPVDLSEKTKAVIHSSNQVVQKIIKSREPVYGVNTGFGKFSEIRIDNDKLSELQTRLVFSHAAGTGAAIPIPIVRLILLLKIKALSLGHSGCRLEVVEQLVNMLNHNVIPFIPQKGSVGASGDLAPLAHLALVMMGEGTAYIPAKNDQWKQVSGKKALKTAGLKPIIFEAKEGLAVLNGTQVSTAYALWAWRKARILAKSADIIGAVTLEALLGTLTPFDPRIHRLRNHPGQRIVAANFRKILKGSPMVASHKENDERVQDAYCLRCIPQVHGAVRDAITYVGQVLLREINSVTDNPLIFPDSGQVLSGGNFHAAPIGYISDFLGIVLSDLANISERRIEHMQDACVSFLPGFLTRTGGLNSGFMIAQVTAAALCSENKVLAHPASVDSIPTSANKEDHVSMATHAARKAVEIADNLEMVLAVELISCCQALDLRTPLLPSRTTGAALEIVRTKIPYWKDDRQMYIDMEKARDIIESGDLISEVEKVCGPLH
ncbi:MAG: histidine ammonia-lyase [Calditrichales bacterium]|nr:MAG: histidine ammonia-lyase [Calditrichales bacterium]